MSIELTATKTYDGPRRAVIQASAMAVDDAGPTELSLAALVDISTLTPEPEQVRVSRIVGGVEYGVVELFWSATPPVRFAVLSGNALDFKYESTGALRKPEDSDGNILISTTGFGPTSTFMLNIELVKRVT
jgi:hypothetical protein